MSGYLAGFLPDASHRWLLRAALFDDSRAVEAWGRWQATVDFDDMDAASMRLMPLVAHNLKTLGHDYPLARRMRGIHRYWWSRNQVLFHGLAKVLDDFASRGLDVMLLKGVPLAIDAYDDPGLRPMSDYDLLVRTADASAAIDLLVETGWKLNEPVRVRHADGSVDTHSRPGVSYRGGPAQECDIHWHMLHDCCFDGAEDDVWGRAIKTRLLGREFLRPDDGDLLLHLIVHGAAYNPMPPVRWIADSTIVLRAAKGAIDWERLADRSDRLMLSAVMRAGLELLREEFEAPIPDAAIARFRSARVSSMERRELATRLVDQNYMRTLVGRICQLERQTRGEGAVARLAALPGFMQRIWGVERKRDLPLVFLRYVLPAYYRRLRFGELVVVSGRPGDGAATESGGELGRS